MQLQCFSIFLYLFLKNTCIVDGISLQHVLLPNKICKVGLMSFLQVSLLPGDKICWYGSSMPFHCNSLCLLTK